MGRWLAVSVLAMSLAGCSVIDKSMPKNSAPRHSEITTQAEDGVTVFATTYFANLPDTAPLVLLFHQGGSNARAEYAPLIPWLLENEFRVIAWDLRAGGDIFGLANRTADAMLPEEASSYCEGYGDMKAALAASLPFAASGEAIIWGSSYSGALVVHLAADNPQVVSAVVSASPASGSPMAACLARARLGDLKSPTLVLRPASEMERESAKMQKALFDNANVPVLIFEDGVHGSSMLVDARTEADMTNARAAVMAWLTQTLDPS